VKAEVAKWRKVITEAKVPPIGGWPPAEAVTRLIGLTQEHDGAGAINNDDRRASGLVHWHFASFRCGANVRTLFEVKRTSRARCGRVDPKW